MDLPHRGFAATAKPADHFIPMPVHEVLERLGADDSFVGATPVLGLLSNVLTRETRESIDRLKRSHLSLAPSATMGRSRTAVDAAPADWEAFLADLRRSLERANYKELSREAIEEAFASEALFQVRVDVDLEAFATLMIFVRGGHRRTETVRRWFGLRRRIVDMLVFDRVFFLSSPRPGGSGLDPSATLTMKLFAEIPSADLEMLFPNSRVRMRPIDTAVIAVPAIVAFSGLVAKLVGSALALYALTLYWIGWSSEEPPEGVTAAAAAAAAGFFALVSFCIGRYSSYKNKHLRFASSLTRTLYFQTLDSDAGAFYRLLEEATEEEIKEAWLAYAFLLRQPDSERNLDLRIEGWLAEATGLAVDFEVDDAVSKLERLGIASRDAAGLWHVLPPEEARSILKRRWSDLAESPADSPAHSPSERSLAS